MKTQLSKQEKIFLGALVLPFVYLAVRYFLSDSLLVYDAPGHLGLIWNIKANLWPAWWGWNSASLLGFDQGLYYPQLFHYLAAVLSFFVGIDIATKILITAFLTLTPVSVYYFCSKVFTDFRSKIFVASFVVLLLLVLPGYLGGGIKALTQVGLLPSFVATPLVFFYLGKILSLRRNNFLSTTLLLVAIVLTHLVAGIFCGLVLFVVLFVRILSKGFESTYLWHLLTALSLTSFFWLPMLVGWGYTSVSAHVTSLDWPNAVSLMLAFLLLISFWLTKKINLVILAVVATVLSLTGVVDTTLSRFAPNTSLFEKLYSLHLYRYQIYSYLVLAVLLLYWPTVFLFSLKRPKVKPVFLLVAPLLVVVVLTVWRPPFLINKATIMIETISSTDGRFIETFSREVSSPFTYSAQTKLTLEKSESWAYGLFTDATVNGPFLGSLIKSLSINEAKSTNKFLIEDKRIDLKRIPDVLSLFGIGNLLYMSPDQPRRASGENFFIMKNREQSLVEVPKQEIKFVQSSWKQAVYNWWFAPGQLTTLLLRGDQRSVVVNKLALPELPTIKNHNKNWSEFTINIPSSEAVPVLVKFGYSPAWKAYDSNHQEVHIFQTSPSLMTVFARGQVQFKYQTPWYQQVSLYFSLAVALLLIFVALRKLNVWKK